MAELCARGFEQTRELLSTTCWILCEDVRNLIMGYLHPKHNHNLIFSNAPKDFNYDYCDEHFVVWEPHLGSNFATWYVRLINALVIMGDAHTIWSFGSWMGTACYVVENNRPVRMRDWFCRHPNFRLLAVQQNGEWLKHIREQNEEICRTAVANNPNAVRYVKKRLLYTNLFAKDANDSLFGTPASNLRASKGVMDATMYVPYPLVTGAAVLSPTATATTKYCPITWPNRISVH